MLEKCKITLYYKNIYRFTSENVDRLTEIFLEEGDETRGKAITPKQQMEIFLICVADPGFQIGVGEEEGVHKSTVCKIFGTVLNNITRRAADFIKFPTTDRQILDAQELWQQKYNIPFVLGALDCTHVKMNKPHQFGDEYINRKGFASLNVQATCDANEMFTSVDCQWPGSVQDSRIWKNSCVYNFLKTKLNVALLGDMGYPISPWCITPYHNPQNISEELMDPFRGEDPFRFLIKT